MIFDDAAKAALQDRINNVVTFAASLDPVAPAPAPAPAPAGWTLVAEERQDFTVAGTRTVRYGVGSNWVQRQVSGAASCTNAFFGSDPAHGINKRCEVADAPAAPAPAPAPTPPSPSPAPTPPAPPSSGGPVLFFSPDGDDANPGTYASPKRSPLSLEINAMAAGTRLRFLRGGQFLFDSTEIRLSNAAASRANPLVFEGYGEHADKPVLQWSGGFRGFEFGLSWDDPTVHGGYAFRGLDIRGPGLGGPESFGFWSKGNVDGIAIDGCDLSGWYIALNGQGDQNSRHVSLMNCHLHGNQGIPILGTFHDSLIANNDFDNSLVPGNHLVHQIYLSSGDRNVVRGNRMKFSRPASSGTLTVHGYVPTSLIVEDNEIEYEQGPNGEQSDEGAWLISITPYDDPGHLGGFNGLVVRRNKLRNGGNCAIRVMSAPGAQILNNEVRLDYARAQAAVMHNDNSEDVGDLRGPATISGNRAFGPAGSQFSFDGAAGSSLSDNLVTLT